MNSTRIVEAGGNQSHFSFIVNTVDYTVLEGGYIHGTWFCGRPTEKYYGSFPKGFWNRAKKLFKVGHGLHWFCGKGPREDWMVTVDGNPDVSPDFLVEGTVLPFKESEFDTVFADPPYSPQDSKRYGFPYPSGKKVLAEMGRICKPGGRVFLLHRFLPVIKGSGLRLIGCIGIINGPCKSIRGLFIFEKPVGAKQGQGYQNDSNGK